MAPRSIKGQEAIYVAGKNDGKLLAHPAAPAGKWVPTFSLAPDGPLAMRDQRYPLTRIGLANLVKELVAVGERDLKHDECQVRFFTGGKVNDRPCTWFEVAHPVPRPFFRFHLARVFVNDELNFPIRYEAYSWPKQPGDPPELLEEYTYLNLKLNNGFADIDFSRRNPAYHFR